MRSELKLVEMGWSELKWVEVRFFFLQKFVNWVKDDKLEFINEKKKALGMLGVFFNVYFFTHKWDYENQIKRGRHQFFF